MRHCMSLGACFQKKPFPRPAERAGSREPREPARAVPATLAAALHPAAQHWTQPCYWKDEPLLPSHSVTSFACYRRRGQGDLLLAAFFFFFFDVQELLSRFDEQMSLFLTIADVSCRLHGVWQSLVSLLALSGEAACAEERYLVGPVFFL